MKICIVLNIDDTLVLSFTSSLKYFLFAFQLGSIQNFFVSYILQITSYASLGLFFSFCELIAESARDMVCSFFKKFSSV